MRLIPLSQGKDALVDEVDHAYLNQYSWYWVKNGGKGGYAQCGQTKVDIPRSTQMHKIVWQLHNGLVPVGMIIDHKNNNGLHNYLTNLRLATYVQNAANSDKRRGTSQYKGVCRDSRSLKWQSNIRLNNENKSLGLFSSELDAALAYNKAAQEHFGEFARLNVIP